MKTMRKLVAVLIVLMTASLLVLGAAARDNTTVEAPYFNVKPTIDGVVSTAEWGQPTGSAIVYCGRKDYKYDEDDNVMCSAQCFMDPSIVMYVNDISFDFWLRWDEQYFYIAVVSKDKYGIAAELPKEDEDPEWKYSYLWAGDALQFGIDPAGANSTGNPADPFFSDTSKYTYVFGWINYLEGTTGVRNDANKGELIPGALTGITWNPGVWPTIGGQPNSDPGYLSYEIAVPVAAFDGNIAEGKTNGFGVSVARVSATPADATDDDGNVIGTGVYENWLSWGDDVMGSLKDQLPEYRCGSNCAILVDTPAIGDGAADAPEAVTEPAAAEEPEEETEAEEPADADADEPSDADGEETAADDAGETEENAEDVTEEAENAEETEEEKAEGEATEEEKADDKAEEETEAEAGDKAIDDTGDENEEKPGAPVGAIIGIIAAVVVIAAVVAVVLAKKKK